MWGDARVEREREGGGQRERGGGGEEGAEGFIKTSVSVFSLALPTPLLSLLPLSCLLQRPG